MGEDASGGDAFSLPGYIGSSPVGTLYTLCQMYKVAWKIKDVLNEMLDPASEFSYDIKRFLK